VCFVTFGCDLFVAACFHMVHSITKQPFTLCSWFLIPCNTQAWELSEFLPVLEVQVAGIWRGERKGKKGRRTKRFYFFIAMFCQAASHKRFLKMVQLTIQFNFKSWCCFIQIAIWLTLVMWTEAILFMTRAWKLNGSWAVTVSSEAKN